MIRLTEAVKHLLIINIILYVATYYLVDENFIIKLLSLHSVQSPLFEPWQIITYMFMHGSLAHIIFNMFSLWMFGSTLENVWGTKKFIVFYLLTGIGSAVLYLVIKYFQIQSVIPDFSGEELNLILTDGADAIVGKRNFVDEKLGSLNALINGQMLGASGAIAGLLMAFGILFPNVELMLIFLPIPIKAKYFIPLLIIYEFSMEFANFSWDNIAHLAHITGMIIGFILIKIWKKNQFRIN